MSPGYLFSWPLTRYSNHIAIKYHDIQRTYGEIESEINRLCNGLFSLGLKPRQKVAILLRNCLEAVIAPFAVTRAGMCQVSLNFRHSAREHASILDDAEVDAIIVGEEFINRLDPLLPAIKSLKQVIIVGQSGQGYPTYQELLVGQSDTRPDVNVDYDNDIVRIQYTSGTSGKPKGVVWTFRIYDNVLLNTLVNMDQTILPTDVNLNCGPLSHAAGLMLTTYYIKGSVNVILPGFDEEAVLKTIARERVTSLLLVPTMFYRLLLFPGLKDYDLSSIRRIWYGTAPMSVERLKEGIRLFGPVFRQNYGMTEIPQPILFLGPEDHVVDGTDMQTRRLSSAGKPALGVEIKIADEEGEAAETGEIGEILIRSDKLMREYWKQPDETARVFKDGWFHSRDMAKKDEDGYIYIVDRKSDMIITGGFNVYPREVEEVIRSCPGVTETVVIGIPDDVWGEAIKAFVILNQAADLTEADIISHCADRLAGYKKPKSVDFVTDIPKTEIGKFDRKILKKPFWEKSDRQVH